MTTIKKNKYIFSVDIEKTQEYYKTHSLCNCVCCRNYYAQIKEQLPKLDAFLREFGIDVSRPDEIGSIEMEDYIDYLSADYTACGKVEKFDKYEIEIHDNLLLSIIVNDGFSSPNEQTGDYFTISVTGIRLPWVLDEPFPKPTKSKFVNKIKQFFIRYMK